MLIESITKQMINIDEMKTNGGKKICCTMTIYCQYDIKFSQTKIMLKYVIKL